MAPYNALAVANYFLDKAKADGIPLTPMKLQKLIYFAHGWYLALYGEPLINEQVQAWDYGPVVSSVYHEFKKFGSGRIDQPGTDLDPESFEFITPRISNTDSRTIALLDKVWEVYGKYTGIQLSNLTHEAGSAWTETRNNPEHAGLRSVGIPNQLIRQDFERKRAA